MKSLIVGNETQAIRPISNNANSILPKNNKQTRFANVLKLALENTSKAELQADLKTEALANGEVEDLHNVMIAAQKASITLEATVQVQSKVIDAYNEIMRMQV